MGKESHSGAGKRKGSSSSSSNQKNISSKSEDEVNEKWKSSSKTKGKAGSKASSRNYTKAEPSGGKSGRRVLYLSMLVTVLAIIVWPLSRYCGVDKELWRPVEFVQNFFNVQREQPRVEVPEKQAINIWTLDRRCGLSLEEFIDTYDGKRPVLITDALTGWKANNWNKEFFVQNYGNQRVHMKAVKGSLSQAEGLALPLHLFAQHSGEGGPRIWTYLEDELFIQLHPELRTHLGDPIYLKEDFFQLFPAEVRPWNAMLLWGTAYSRSYLHIDPYNWTGTNAVFSGKKLWKLYPPGQDDYLYVMRNRKSEFPLNCFKYNSPVDAFNPDLKKYPRFAKARAISFAQRPGEILIIPPGWFHQAFNEDETIAVSSQVMNSQNFHIVLEEIFKAGNIDRNTLPSNFYKRPPVDQVSYVMRSLSSSIIQRGKEVTNEILRKMGYPTK